jgi:hypothetical protein
MLPSACCRREAVGWHDAALRASTGAMMMKWKWFHARIDGVILTRAVRKNGSGRRSNSHSLPSSHAGSGTRRDGVFKDSWRLLCVKFSGVIARR